MKKHRKKQNSEKGFSLIELLVVVTIMLLIFAIVTQVFSTSLGIRDRETQKTDALTSIQAALNVMSREIGNSGYGLNGNGIVLNDSTSKKLHFRANIENNDLETNDIGEDVIYFYDANIDSVVRYDRFAVPSTSIIINRVSSVTFTYYDYSDTNSTPIVRSSPTKDTGKVKITLMVQLDDVQGQPENQNVSLTTEVSLRNSVYMLNQY